MVALLSVSHVPDDAATVAAMGAVAARLGCVIQSLVCLLHQRNIPHRRKLLVRHHHQRRVDPKLLLSARRRSEVEQRREIENAELSRDVRFRRWSSLLSSNLLARLGFRIFGVFGLGAM